MNILLDLFLTFAKIGLFTFGGGYAMISMIENNCVECKKWITHDEMMNVTVIAESTPGPIAINCATFTGYKKAGFLGALVATLGIVLPSFVVIYLISMFLDNFLALTIIANAFKGIKIAVGILIFNYRISGIENPGTESFTLLSIPGFFLFFIIKSSSHWLIFFHIAKRGWETPSSRPLYVVSELFYIDYNIAFTFNCSITSVTIS